jgi:hypothetical protein
MPIVRKFLTPDEFSNPSLRYDPDCDCVQYTPDGGTTWYDQPAADPRTSPTSRLPALSGDDRACRAAAGMTKLIENSVNERIDAVTAIEFAGGILGIVAFIPGFNILYALILALAAFAFTIGREVLEAAFTEEVYDQIRCILFCHVDDDGQMSVDQLAAAYSDLNALDTIPKAWAQNILATFGAVGMSDAGVALEEAGDCDECACSWCHEWVGEDLSTTWSGSTPATSFQMYLSLPYPINVTHFEADYEITGGGEGGDSSIALGLDGIYANKIAFEGALSSSGTIEWTDEDSEGSTIPTIWGNTNNAFGSTIGVTRVLIRGIGTTPYTDNCE